MDNLVKYGALEAEERETAYEVGSSRVHTLTRGEQKLANAIKKFISFMALEEETYTSEEDLEFYETSIQKTKMYESVTHSVMAGLVSAFAVVVILACVFL